jgi:hypothetical protein
MHANADVSFLAILDDANRSFARSGDSMQGWSKSLGCFDRAAGPRACFTTGIEPVAFQGKKACWLVRWLTIKSHLKMQSMSKRYAKYSIPPLGTNFFLEAMHFFTVENVRCQNASAIGTRCGSAMIG